MAVTSTTIIAQSFTRNKRMVLGHSIVTAGQSGEEIATGLSTTEFFSVTDKQATYSSIQAYSVNETFPLAGGTVTVVSGSNTADFYWMAIGV